MMITDPSILDYLHDALVFEIQYDLRRKGDRGFLVLSVKCDPEAGYPPWDGKRLDVRLDSIVLMQMFACAPGGSIEQINSWGSVVSDSMESEIERLAEHDYDVSGTRFCITFQSGSSLEGLCKRIVVEETALTA